MVLFDQALQMASPLGPQQASELFMTVVDWTRIPQNLCCADTLYNSTLMILFKYTLVCLRGSTYILYFCVIATSSVLLSLQGMCLFLE